MSPFANKWRTTINQVRKPGATRSVVNLAALTMLGQFSLIAISPILTRLYSPETLGVLATYTAGIALGLTICTGRYELAIPIAKTNSDAKNLLALATLLALASPVPLLVLFLVLPQFPVRLGVLYRPDIVCALLVGLPIASIHQVAAHWCIRSQDYETVGLGRMKQGWGISLGQLTAAVLGLSSMGLLIADALGRGGGAPHLIRRAKEGFRAASFSPRLLLRTARKYIRFPLLSASGALINSAGLQAPTLLLAATFGPEAAGIFALSQRVISLPLRFVGSSVAQVYLGHTAELLRENPSGLRANYLKAAGTMGLLVLPFCLLLAIIAPSAFSGVFGAEWEPAGVYARYLSLMLLLQFSVAPFSHTLELIGRLEISAIWNLTRLVLVSGTIIGAYHTGTSPAAAIGYYSIVSAGCYFLLFLICIALLPKQVSNHRTKATL